MKTAITLLAALLAGSGGYLGLSDLCTEDVVVDPATGQAITDKEGTTLSRSCTWTGPGAPLWQDTACCSVSLAGTSCLPPGERGECDAGLSPYFCEYGEQTSDGGLSCYQSFPSACDAGNCTPADSLPFQSPDLIQEDVICCIGGTCWEWAVEDLAECGGVLQWCWDGYLMEDGTVECFD